MHSKLCLHATVWCGDSWQLWRITWEDCSQSISNRKGQCNELRSNVTSKHPARTGNWDELKSVLWKKLKNLEEVRQVLETLKLLFRCNTKAFYSNGIDYQTAKRKEQSQRCCCSLSLFLKNPNLADVIFEIQDISVYAHKAVLVARCDVMAAMFSGNYSETNACNVPIHGVSKETFLSFLEYLYTDSCCTASILQAMALLICAEMYQIHATADM